MRVLVTGAFGFVGSAVVRRLAEAGHDVVAMTHRAVGDGHPEAAAARVVCADLRDVEALRVAVCGVEAICHLAALTGVRESFDEPGLYREINVGGTGALLDAFGAEVAESGRGCGRFVQCSTSAVYGVPELQPISEDAPATPMSPYGESKAAADELVARRVRESGGSLGAVCLRPFNVAGSSGGRTDFSSTRIIPNALAVAAGRAPELQVNGDGGVVRDFVHVDDVAAAFLLALAVCAPGGFRVYNLGAAAASMRDVINAAERVTGRSIPVRRNSPKPEPREIRADTTRARTELGWKPERSSLDQILADAWEVIGPAE